MGDFIRLNERRFRRDLIQTYKVLNNLRKKSIGILVHFSHLKPIRELDVVLESVLKKVHPVLTHTQILSPNVNSLSDKIDSGLPCLKIYYLVFVDLSLLYSTIVWSVALYGSETWTLRKHERDRFEAFEMWTCRNMENISYERSDWRTNGREERKRKAAYHVVGWHQNQWDIWND